MEYKAFGKDINVIRKSFTTGEKGRGNSKPYMKDKRVRRGHYERMRAYMLGKKVAGKMMF